MASDGNTHNPPTVFSRKDDTERMITVAEAEQLLLYPRDITNGGDAKFGFDRAKRMKMIGNAIGGHHLREILYRRKPSQREAVVNNIHANRRNATQSNDQHPDPANITSKELDAALSSMTGWLAGKRLFIQKQRRGY